MFIPISDCHCTRNTSKPQKSPIRSKRPTLMGHSNKSSFRDWDNSVGEKLQLFLLMGFCQNHLAVGEMILFDESSLSFIWIYFLYCVSFFPNIFFYLNFFPLTFVWWISYKSQLILSFNKILFHKSEACVISSSTIWRNA